MSSVVCAHCHKPTSAGFICTVGMRKLRTWLLEVSWLVDELNVTISKQSQSGVGGGGKNSATDSPLMLNVAASDALAALTNLLVPLATNMAKNGQPAEPVRYPGPVGAAGFLLRRSADWMKWEHVGVFYANLKEARQSVYVSIDRPPDRVYLGPCGAELTTGQCTEILWGETHKDKATCKTCAAEWPRQLREQQIYVQALEGMEDRIMTAEQAAETLIAYGVAHGAAGLLADRIRKWATPRPGATKADPDRPPRIRPKTQLMLPGARRRPGYKLGDIMAILKQIDERRARTATKAGTR